LFTRDGLLALHRWTHEALEPVFEHAARLPGDLLRRELSEFGSRSVHDQLVHVLANEQTWVRALQFLPPLEPPSLEDRPGVIAGTVRYIKSASDVNAELHAVPPNWVGPPRSPAFILHHVCTHAFHHKGQIVAMFRILGHPAPDTDLQRAS
jgi:uncharacterized damage-inducible protein DinB